MRHLADRYALTPPPPYEQQEYSLVSTPDCMANETRFLRRALIEILAVTFDANFMRLNASMHAQDRAHRRRSRKKFSILSADEAVALQELCTLVRTLEDKHRHNEWSATLQSDRDQVKFGIIYPAFFMNIAADYVLEMIGRFGDGQNRGANGRGTLLGHFTPRYTTLRFKSSRAMIDLGDTLRSHSRLIQELLQEDQYESVRVVLGRALGRYQDKNGLRSIHHSGRDLCWPLSNGYMDFHRKLDPGGGASAADRFEKSRLREHRDLKEQGCLWTCFNGD